MQTAQTTNSQPTGRAARFAAWDAALRRAISSNLTVLELAGNRFAISSSRNPDAGYLVDEHFSCDCPSTSPYCMHAALAMAFRGILAWPDYSGEVEVAPVEVVAIGPCPRCGGTGKIEQSYGRLGDPLRFRSCGSCTGTGTAAA